MAAVAEHELDGREFVVGDEVTIADFVLAYTLDWAGEARLLDESLRLRAYMERMYARPNAPLRIAEAFRRVCG
jgi:glutathione S-transferase